MTNPEMIYILAAAASILSGLLGAGIIMGIMKQRLFEAEKDIEKNTKRIDNLVLKLEPLANDVSKIKVHIEWLVKEYKTKNGSK